MIRHSLRLWIEQTLQCKVCGEADNGQSAIEKVEELRPDIVIMDFQMPVMNGLVLWMISVHLSRPPAVSFADLHAPAS